MTHTHGFPFVHYVTTSLPGSRHHDPRLLLHRSKPQGRNPAKNVWFSDHLGLGHRGRAAALGHQDIRATSSHHVEKKKRVEISLSMTATELKAVTS